MNASFGHNEITARLGLLAEDARKGLARVAAGEADAIEGWLAYGAALNEGRALFPSDEQFGQWVVSNNLLHTGDEAVNRPERAAAMWAAANPEQFAEARAAGNARTVRGIHAKWKEIVAEREAQADRERAEAARLEAARIAEQEEEARRQAQQAQDEAERQDAADRAARFREQRREADIRAREAELNASKHDPGSLREGLREAINETHRRPSNRNPHHVPDARRDRVINFTGECARIADADDLSELAAFDGHPAFRQQMLQQARAAHSALTRFLNMVEPN